jgi:hypothetical protein
LLNSARLWSVRVNGETFRVGFKLLTGLDYVPGTQTFLSECRVLSLSASAMFAAMRFVHFFNSRMRKREPRGFPFDFYLAKNA